MPRAVRVRRGAQADRVVLVDVRQVRECVVVALVFGVKFGDQIGIEFGESVAAGLAVKPPDRADDLPDDTRDLVAVGPEIGVLAHERPHDRAHIGLAVVFERVEQGVLLGFLFHAFAEFVIHWLCVSRDSSKAAWIERLTVATTNR
ncbi:MAG: hypothetical protein A07HN63_02430 [uncultured archaeon A07HN63]|nr:MAG: hypothetical protein A07HN63_02430 [uncultured archaeon A07HN63]